MGRAVFRIVQSARKHALEHVGDFRERDNALRPTGLKDRCGPFLNVRLVEKNERRIVSLRRKPRLHKCRANGEAITDHANESLFLGVAQIDAQEDNGPGLSKMTPCIFTYQSGHVLYLIQIGPIIKPGMFSNQSCFQSGTIPKRPYLAYGIKTPKA
jgi:hypothetical protein